MGKRGNAAGDESDDSDEDRKDTEAEKMQKKKKRENQERRKRADAGGSAQNSTKEDRSSIGEEQAEPMTTERRIYRGRKTRELMKMNDGGN